MLSVATDVRNASCCELGRGPLSLPAAANAPPRFHCAVPLVTQAPAATNVTKKARRTWSHSQPHSRTDLRTHHTHVQTTFQPTMWAAPTAHTAATTSVVPPAISRSTGAADTASSAKGAPESAPAAGQCSGGAASEAAGSDATQLYTLEVDVLRGADVQYYTYVDAVLRHVAAALRDPLRLQRLARRLTGKRECPGCLHVQPASILKYRYRAQVQTCKRESLWPARS